MLYESGVLYGTTSGNYVKGDHGTVFKLDASNGTETVLQDFSNHSGPQDALIKAGNALYGTVPSTTETTGFGSVFQINLTTGKLLPVYSFTGGGDGGYPTAALLNIGGVLCGITNSVTSANAGTVFRLDKSARTRIVF